VPARPRRAPRSRSQEAEAEEEAAAAGGAADKDGRPTHVGAGARGDEGGEEDSDDEETERRWNLRKCSAMGLDHLSNVYNDDILPLLMPVVEARLGDADWRKRESAILALGAVRCGAAAAGARGTRRVAQGAQSVNEAPAPRGRRHSLAFGRSQLPLQPPPERPPSRPQRGLPHGAGALPAPGRVHAHPPPRRPAPHGARHLLLGARTVRAGGGGARLGWAGPQGAGPEAP
jgi:hypothetical protein